MTTHCNKVEGFMAFNSLMKCQYSSTFPIFFRVIAWMFQGSHINLKGNVNLLCNVPLSSKQLQIETVFHCTVPMFPVCQKDEGKGARKIAMYYIGLLSSVALQSLGWRNQVQTSDYWVSTGDVQFLSAVCCTHVLL